LTTFAITIKMLVMLVFIIFIRWCWSKEWKDLWIYSFKCGGSIRIN